jgi:hypothetical protein
MEWWSLWQISEINIMAKQSVNKSALVRDYLAKYPEKGPAAIAQRINQEKGVKVSGKYVASVKTKLKQASGSAAVAPKPTPTASTPAKKKPAPAKGKSTATKTVSAPASLAPRMIQSMEILQLPIMTLQERIQQELQENPVLELKDSSDEPTSAAGLSQHIANLKAAAQRLGKDEAKRIIDLF